MLLSALAGSPVVIVGQVGGVEGVEGVENVVPGDLGVVVGPQGGLGGPLQPAEPFFALCRSYPLLTIGACLPGSGAGGVERCYGGENADAEADPDGDFYGVAPW